MVYGDFELVDKRVAPVLFKQNANPTKLKCSFVGDNRIIFHYPFNTIGNTNYMCLISTISEDNNFINEYLLIYKDYNSYQNHFNKIKYNIINYANIEFINNAAPIVGGVYHELGTIINLNGPPPAPPIDDPPPIKNPHYRNLKHPKYYPVGLENIGATCYMNATLQCLCNIKKFFNFFKYNKHLIEKVREDVFTLKKNEKLCSSFKFLVDNLFPSPGKRLKKYYTPKEFKEKISEMNSLFKGVAANDAKDLINFLIMTLHGELNKVQNPVEVGGGNLFQEQTNKELMFKRFAANFAANNQSIISDLFYALNCNVTKCGNCQTCSFNYQIYFFLIFPLEEVRKFKYGNNNFYNTVDIYDCFNFDQKVGVMGGENSMYCNYCKQTSPSYMCTNLTTGPEILIIILNRGKGIQFKVRINFSETLNLQNYIELGQTGTQYRLIGVITHLGDSSMSGHFIAYCLNFIFNKWFQFNDAMVNPVNNFQNEVINYAMPYVLFYQKINGN